MTVKISISLADESLAALDKYIQEKRIPSRSAAIQLSIQQLTAPDLRTAYFAAAEEWENSADAGLWETVSGEGLR
ncbi:MAG: ribbon-helix-helix domain-containing protein [Buchananella hordeovulneris]|nr:ribbon-helix-helix domain-containing protein [Buchananella hordeovulneris]